MNLFDLQSAQSTAAKAHHERALSWFTHLGPLGISATAVLDSSVIPLPLSGSTDLMVLWLVSQGERAWLIVSAAVAGSVLGFLMKTFQLAFCKKPQMAWSKAGAQALPHVKTATLNGVLHRLITIATASP